MRVKCGVSCVRCASHSHEHTAAVKAHRSEVGQDAEVFLGAALGDAEARHDLVKAQQRAVVCAQLPEALQLRIRPDVSKRFQIVRLSEDSIGTAAKTGRNWVLDLAIAHIVEWILTPWKLQFARTI